MRKIFNYNNFINESIDNELNLLLEAKIVYNDDFMEILNNIESPISKELKSIQNKEVDVNTNYIGIDPDKNDYIVFRPDDKVEKVKSFTKNGISGMARLAYRFQKGGYDIKDINHVNDNQEVEIIKNFTADEVEEIIGGNSYDTDNVKLSHIRFQNDDNETCEIIYPTKDLVKDFSQVKSSPYKVGRFVTNILKKANIDFTNQEVEDFVSKFKAEIKKKNDMLNNFEIVKGEDIRKYYLADNYLTMDGTLGNSCMRFEKCQTYFDIYVENENVSLLILRNKDKVNDWNANNDDKIIGRALLWNAVQDSTEKEVKFMDRIYINDHSDIELFKLYAIKNGFFYKYNQDYSNIPLVYDGKTLSKQDSFLTVNINTGGYKHYPYIDTLSFYNESNGYLTNDSTTYYDYELTTTNGMSEYCMYCNGDNVVACDECGASGEINCENCEKGYVPCDECGSTGQSKECEDCDGSGSDRDGNDCERCDSRGGWDCVDCNGLGNTECSVCNGDGNTDCSVCDGDGQYRCPYCD